MSKIFEIVIALYSAGILLPIALFLIRFLKSKVKNQKLQVLATYAEQAVVYAESKTTGSEAKYNEAVSYLTSLIKNSGLKLNVPDEQMKALIEEAVLLLKNKI
ncbi:phage holin, LLH family [Lactococcus sp.]|uniref:phage holin, LLH family n=1 Tax=Lactococcus sp. TaxID=44273 RepID=UPI0035AFB098